MKRRLILLAILVFAGTAYGQSRYGLKVGYFSNNPGPAGIADQKVRIVNTGAKGSPMSPGEGAVCANIYVYDANQEMVSCCACKITANALLTLSVANDLTKNPLTSVVPINGSIEIIPDYFGPPCDATKLNIVPTDDQELPPTPLADDLVLVGFDTHVQTSGGTIPGTFITETKLLPIPFTYENALFEAQACKFVNYLGGGKGVCSCGK